MVLQSEYPPDIRLTKEIKALTSQNHNIYLLCNNNKSRHKKDFVDGANIIRLYKFSFLPAKIQKLIRLPLFFNPIWIYKIIKIIIQYKIDSIHVHDLPLAPLAVFIGKIFSKPVVYDMHENYPAAMQEWKQNKLVRYTIKNPAFARVLNNLCLKFASKVIVVVEEQKENLMNQGLPEDKIVIVSNTVDLENFCKIEIKNAIIESWKNYFSILYLGSFSSERGLETPIKSLKLLKEQIPNICLLFVGDGKNATDLKQLAIENGVEDLVRFTGWVDFEDVPSYMQASSICIIPQPSNPANDTTIPHKLFQYMALGKPIITSDAKPLKRIVEECECGETFTSNSTKSFIDAVYKIKALNTNYKENGKKAVKEQYNWQNSSKELIRLYNTI